MSHTPEDKAKELVGLFDSIKLKNPVAAKVEQDEHARDSAIICVNEILQVLSRVDECKLQTLYWNQVLFYLKRM